MTASKKPRWSYQKAIAMSFNLLLLGTVFLFHPYTSEVFEFNKIVALYFFTGVVFLVWILNIIVCKTLIWKNTLLHVPLLIFLLTQIISTLTSLSPETSVFGYYSRFNGGLLSIISYVFLYLIWTSYINKKLALQFVNTMLIALFLISIWTILEHSGRSPSCIFIASELNSNCWTQDVTKRAFATLGQPNWLAMWIVGVLPLILSHRFRYPLFTLGFIALLFTGSRSGFIAFIGTFGTILVFDFIEKVHINKLIGIGVISLLCILIIGSPLSRGLLSPPPTPPVEGVTDSLSIRTLVWEGAVQVWTEHPITGTGLETFAYSYFNHRPLAHNLTSEWNHIYNKAHNEFLNYAANTGTLGLSAYIVFLASALFVMYLNIKRANSSDKTIQISLLAGFIGMNIASVFGFFVVATSLLLFLFPAISIAIAEDYNNKLINHSFSELHFLLKLIAVLFFILFIFILGAYWYADFQYAKGSRLNRLGEYNNATIHLEKAILIYPHGDYIAELAHSYKDLAIQESKNIIDSIYKTRAITLSDNIASKYNYNIKLSKYIVYVYIDLEEYHSARELLKRTSIHAPNDPQIYYLLGLIEFELGNTKGALEQLSRAITAKPNYARAQELAEYIKGQDE